MYDCVSVYMDSAHHVPVCAVGMGTNRHKDDSDGIYIEVIVNQRLTCVRDEIQLIFFFIYNNYLKFGKKSRPKNVSPNLMVKSNT